MRGHVTGKSSTEGMLPHVIRAWELDGKWYGAVFVGRQPLHTVGPCDTRDAVFALAEDQHREDVKAGLYVSAGVVRDDHVRVVARRNGTESWAVTWVPRGTTDEVAASRFAPGYRVVSIDGIAVAFGA